MIGWGTWIRTKTDGVRVRCTTIILYPSSNAVFSMLRGDCVAVWRTIRKARESAVVRPVHHEYPGQAVYEIGYEPEAI